MGHRNSANAIVREGFPVSSIPRRRDPRLEWLDALEWQVAVDVATTFTELRNDGWPADAAVEHCAGFVRWLAGHLEDGAEIGLAIARALDSEAA